MLPAGIQKRFLDTGLEPAGMTNGNLDTHLCGAIPRYRTLTEYSRMAKELLKFKEISVVMPAVKGGE
jgi:hypothetical protein